MTKRSVRLSTNYCPSCHHELDSATSIDKDEDIRPTPGAITICLYCGHMMAFADDLSFRKLTDEEMREIAGDRRVLAIQRARKVIEGRKKK